MINILDHEDLDKVDKVKNFVNKKYKQESLIPDVIIKNINKDNVTFYIENSIEIHATGTLIITNDEAYVTCLASNSASYILRLFKFIGKCLIDKNIKKIKADVHPKYANFYKNIIGCEVSDKVETFDIVGGAEAVAIELVLDKEVLSKKHGWKELWN